MSNSNPSLKTRFKKGHKINNGRIFTEEHKKRLSEAMKRKGIKPPSRKGFKQSEVAKKHLSEAKRREKHPNWGKHLSKETRRKLSEAHKGHKVSEETKKKHSENLKKRWAMGLVKPPMLGKKMSVEQRRKMSGIRKGEKSSNWKGGISEINHRIREGIEFRLWREVIFARDNWICQKCSQRGYKLHPHHIQNFAQFPELRFAIDNGITFCEKCHKLFHKIFGQRNNTKEQIKEFLH